MLILIYNIRKYFEIIYMYIILRAKSQVNPHLLADFKIIFELKN